MPDSALVQVIAECDALVVQEHGPHYDPDAPLAVTVHFNDYLAGMRTSRISRRRLPLDRPAASVSQVREERRGFTLTPDDYARIAGGRTLLRLCDGTHPVLSWDDEVHVTYQPADDNIIRRKMIFDLTQLYLTDNKLASVRAGDFASTSRDIGAEKRRILAQLHYDGGLVSSGYTVVTGG